MEENNITNATPVRHKRRTRSFFWPIVLIFIGVLLLLSNLGIMDWGTWTLLWRFWPLILVAIGIDVLIGQRSTAGAVVSGFLILAFIGAAAGVVFFADQLPFIASYSSDSPWQTDTVEQALDDYQSASILIDWASPSGKLQALSNSDNLIEGELTYQGDLFFDVSSRGTEADIRLDTRSTAAWFNPSLQTSPPGDWDISLTPEIPLDLTLDTGSGSCEFDLSELTLSELFLDSGSGSINLELPAEQSYPVEIDSGSGSIRITIPKTTGVRVKVDSGSGSFNPGDRFNLVSGERGGDGTWESEDFDTAEVTIEMEIDQGSGSITFR